MAPREMRLVQATRSHLICAVLVGSLALPSVTVATAASSVKAHIPWCRARQLSLTNAKGPHTIQLSSGSAYWILQIRNHGRSPCLAGGSMDFTGAQATGGQQVKVTFRHSAGAFGASPKAFVLPRRGRAFAQVQDPIPSNAQAARGCRAPVRLALELPHNGGRLTVRSPDKKGTFDQFGVCPELWIAVSPTYSATVFEAAMRREF